MLQSFPLDRIIRNHIFSQWGTKMEKKDEKFPKHRRKKEGSKSRLSLHCIFKILKLFMCREQFAGRRIWHLKSVISLK